MPPQVSHFLPDGVSLGTAFTQDPHMPHGARTHICALPALASPAALRHADTRAFASTNFSHQVVPAPQAPFPPSRRSAHPHGLPSNSALRVLATLKTPPSLHSYHRCSSPRRHTPRNIRHPAMSRSACPPLCPPCPLPWPVPHLHRVAFGPQHDHPLIRCQDSTSACTPVASACRALHRTLIRPHDPLCSPHSFLVASRRRTYARAITLPQICRPAAPRAARASALPISRPLLSLYEPLRPAHASSPCGLYYISCVRSPPELRGMREDADSSVAGSEGLCAPRAQRAGYSWRAAGYYPARTLSVHGARCPSGLRRPCARARHAHCARQRVLGTAHRPACASRALRPRALALYSTLAARGAFVYGAARRRVARGVSGTIYRAPVTRIQRVPCTLRLHLLSRATTMNVFISADVKWCVSSQLVRGFPTGGIDGVLALCVRTALHCDV